MSELDRTDWNPCIEAIMIPDTLGKITMLERSASAARADNDFVQTTKGGAPAGGAAARGPVCSSRV